MGVHAKAFNHKVLLLDYSGDLESGFNNLGLYISNSKAPLWRWVQDLDAKDEMSSMAKMVVVK
ncbi:unnamed protein product [Malus baccata var. baccata]